MKDSGVGWIGDIPDDWEVTKIRYAARLESGHTPSRQHPEWWIPEECVIPWVSLADVGRLRSGDEEFIDETVESISEIGMANSSARLLPAGSVVLSRTASVGFSAVITKPMATTQDFVNWVCGPDLAPDYLLYVFRAMTQEFERLRFGSVHNTIYMPDVRSFSTPLPPRVVQERIVSFLRRVVPELNALIAKKRRLVSLLRERRQAAINEAVTRGLDRSVRMKESGIPWLGQIPEHWELARIKHVATLESGHTPSRGNPEHWRDDNDIPWVSLADTKTLASSDYITDTAHCINHLGLENSSAHMLPEHVVVFTRDASIGLAAITTRPMAVSQHIIAWVCGERILPEYLLRVFYAMTPELESRTMGSTLKTIGMPDVKRLTTPLPPRDEQRQIVEFLVDQVGQLDALITRVDTHIDKLREYRRALIAAAVTGKLDVAEPSKAVA